MSQAPPEHPVYIDGVPANLEAAAWDVLDWLRYIEELIQRGGAYTGQDLFRLQAAISALERFVSQEEMEFRTTDPPPTEPSSQS